MTLLHPTPDTRTATVQPRRNDAPARVCGGKDSSTEGTACSFPPRWQLGAPVLAYACNVHAIWALDRQLTEGHSVTLVKLARSSTAREPSHTRNHDANHNHNQEIKP